MYQRGDRNKKKEKQNPQDVKIIFQRSSSKNFKENEPQDVLKRLIPKKKLENFSTLVRKIITKGGPRNKRGRFVR